VVVGGVGVLAMKPVLCNTNLALDHIKISDAPTRSFCTTMSDAATIGPLCFYR